MKVCVCVYSSSRSLTRPRFSSCCRWLCCYCCVYDVQLRCCMYISPYVCVSCLQKLPFPTYEATVRVYDFIPGILPMFYKQYHTSSTVQSALHDNPEHVTPPLVSYFQAQYSSCCCCRISHQGYSYRCMLCTGMYSVARYSRSCKQIRANRRKT